MSHETPLDEGWYLMNLAEVERVAASLRAGRPAAPPGAIRVEVAEALAQRDAGNVPDAEGRSLRLVLIVDTLSPLALERRRLLYEPDFHDQPSWRRPQSQPVQVIPVARRDPAEPDAPEAWWEDEDLATLEQEWNERGTVSGLPVPGPYRGFVYKTVLALRAADREVTQRSVADSVARWLPRADAEALRRALGVQD